MGYFIFVCVCALHEYEYCAGTQTEAHYFELMYSELDLLFGYHIVYKIVNKVSHHFLCRFLLACPTAGLLVFFVVVPSTREWNPWSNRCSDVLCSIKYDKQSQEPTKHINTHIHRRNVWNLHDMPLSRQFFLHVLCTDVEMTGFTWLQFAAVSNSIWGTQRQRERERRNGNVYTRCLNSYLLPQMELSKVNIESDDTHSFTLTHQDFSKTIHHTHNISHHQFVSFFFFYGFLENLYSFTDYTIRCYRYETVFVPVSHLKAFRIQWDISKNRINT